MNLLTYSFDNQPVRIVMRDGVPWWVAKDVAEALGYGWAGSASIRHIPDQWKGVNSVLTHSGLQDMAVLSEQGLYFFLGRSDKPKALPFQMWLAGDVVPSIHKNGMYATDALLDNPEHLLQVTQRLVEERRGRLAAEAKVMELAPKADFHDQVAVAINCQSVADVAKLLGTGEIRFFQWLRDQKILMRNPRNRPYQQYLDEGYFKVREGTFATPKGEQRTSVTTEFTGRGFTWIQKRWAQAGNVVQLQLVGG